MALADTTERPPRRGNPLPDLNSAAFWAGVSTFIFFVFGALTVQISVLREFGISEREQASWITITWLTSALATLPLCLYYRQPLAIGWSLPGILYMGTLADRFTLGEMAVANLAAGAIIVAIAAAGLGSRIINMVPMPILMAMFAASLIAYLTRGIEETVAEPLICGPMIAAYLGGRLLASRRVPPVGLAVIAGIVMSVVMGETNDISVENALPALQSPGYDFDAGALLSITLPMVILVIGLGNIQSLGFMISEGYRPPANVVTGLIGVMTLANAAFGGHPAAMARTGTAVVSGRDAGPMEARYWAAIIAFVPALAVALATGLVVALVQAPPPAFIFTTAALAILGAFQDSIERAFAGTLRFGCVIAFTVTLSSFQVADIPSAFWALVAGIGASVVLERREIVSFWKRVVSAPHTPLDHVIESMELRRWDDSDSAGWI